MDTRYNRQTILPQVGEQGQQKLLKSKVLLIGAGGLGSAILPYLAAAGVGEIGVVDADVVELSNLQRQVIYTTDSIGKSKVSEAKKSAEALNADCKINVYQTVFSAENALELVAKYDIIVDGTDSIASKYLINDACVVQNKPWVYGSVYRFEGQVSVFNYNNGPSYRCLYPEENRNGLSCVEAGILGVSVGIIGILQANEVLKIILGIGEVNSGKILIYNCLNNLQEKFSFDKKDFLVKNKRDFLQRYTNKKSEVISITAEEAALYLDKNNTQFLDVRNRTEEPKFSLENGLQIPLGDLEQKLSLLDRSQNIVVYCQTGVRSALAAEILLNNNFETVKNVQGGAVALHPFISSVINS